eukprot:CAMPEP_0174252518 /NCGR_PEP_ID=MMETSP0439-20130205/1954_1 /TAXON_ID=0 /ORGANISM="Stereomyxa ramosa, Strain Chinc5" /LENGTH=954 /DNA_ID=CAMNT_0015333069 /DNA_START=71 /DNA_END=2935 /DNA_ORIENTATION=+
MAAFNESRFRNQVDRALQQVRTILDNTRHPDFPADVSHEYKDKYLLANFLTNTAFASQLTCLQSLGLSSSDLITLIEWATSRSVTLCFTAEERCKFDREVTREVESPTKYVKETVSTSGNKTKTHKIVTTVTDYYWKIDIEYELFAYRGNDIDDKVVFQGRKGQITKITSSKSSPRPAVTVRDPIKVNITYLLSNLVLGEGEDSKPTLNFSIDREDECCRTPRRNIDTDNALSHFNYFYSWCGSLHSYFTSTLFPVENDHNLDLSSINANDMFVPVVPLFEDKSDSLKLKGSEMEGESLALVSTSNVLDMCSDSKVSAPLNDIGLFLTEEEQTIERKLVAIGKIFPDNKKIVTVAEANMLVILLHARECAQHFSDGINYIEHMLRTQLIAAIGKIVGPKEFAEYMTYHQRKLYRTAYRPRPFCYAIRRPDHSPEGVVSIEADTNDGEMADPIFTVVRHTETVAAPMSFPLNASTSVEFFGDRYLHAYISHQFAGQSASSLQLVARARQFSSYIILVGTIASATLFQPKYGIIIQNKDDLRLPLLLETIPTPKEFRDAIESLSPEQQRFAQAYRSMQLAGTLFGVCIIQIKPQLEKVLNLPYDSLTKELALTQDLMDLFITYNVPSDLLSFDTNLEEYGSYSTEAKVRKVQANVDAMKKMIQESKDKELAEELQKQQKRQAEQLWNSPPPPPGSGFAFGGGPPAPTTSNLFFSSMQPMQPMRMQSASSPFGAFSAPAPPPAARSLAPLPPPSAPSPSAPPPAPTPTTTTTTTTPKTPKADKSAEPTEKPKKGVEEEDDEVLEVEDYTKLPTMLDRAFEALDEDAALRPTIIKPGKVWTKKSQKGLLSKPTTATLSKTQQKDEKNKAFDLLDGLTKAGCIPVDFASLHVVIAATHCFDKSVMDTVVMDNVNPIEKVERSSLIVATAIQDVPPHQLIKSSQLERVKTYSSGLFAIQQ